MSTAAPKRTPSEKAPAKAAPRPAKAEKGAEKGTAVAIAEARLPYIHGLEERFGDLGVNKTTWRPLVEAVFPSAKTADSVIMALAYCKARKLDPFKRPVNIVPVWDSNRGCMIETVWPSITEHRITAHRTGVYAGIDDTEYGPLETRTFTGRVKRDNQWKDETVEDLEFPAWAKVTVYKMIGGVRCPFTAKVYWLEAYGKQGRSDLPNSMWQQRQHGQLEKCAEAAALRKAFPEEISDPTAEEMEGQVVSYAAPPVPLAEAAAAVPSAPITAGGERAAPQASAVEEAEVIDEATGEVIDPAPSEAPADPLERFKAALAAAKTPGAADKVWDLFEPEMPDGEANKPWADAYNDRRDELDGHPAD